MKLTKRIKVENYYAETEIVIKTKTRNLTRDESYKEFNKILDKVAKSLFDNFFFQDIKLSN